MAITHRQLEEYANKETLCPADETAEGLRNDIARMVDGMTDAQLDKAIILLRQWLLGEISNE